MLNLLKSKTFDNYFAHLSTDKKETLYEHTYLVTKYFTKLIKIHKLETVIDNLIDSLATKKSTDLIKSIFGAIPKYHDLGKTNPNFQVVKMHNPLFDKSDFSFGSNHSKIGAFLLIQRFIPKVNESIFSREEKIQNAYILFAFSHSIKKHHAPALDFLNEYDFDNDFIYDLFSFIDSKEFNLLPIEHQSNLQRMIDEVVLENISKISIKDSFSLFSLLKLNFSLLTASDYLATSHFMNDWGEELTSDFGVFNEELKRKIIYNIENSKIYNKNAYRELKGYNLDFPTIPNNNNLNKLRQNLSYEIIRGIRENIDKNLFYIEAPTGGGKTNLSMIALAEFLRNDINTSINNITKVFCVFPFTTLITQTFESLKETLGLENSEIVQIHSKAGFSQKSSDDSYGNAKLNIIDYQFVNYPIALMSHIKFFDILKSNRKSVNYLLHRIANSVVIIDELQSYSPKEWDKVIYFINKYAKYFNIKFILMSATLPKIDKLLSTTSKKSGIVFEKFINLNKNKEKYFQNPNFANRIKFDFSMLNNPKFNKENFLQNLWEKLVYESENYCANSSLNRVHTIIEFIFKKTASEFIDIANKKNDFFDEIFILSGTILEPRRKEIINKLKADIEYKNKNILLITTQVVEAGVDIDMDLGFKDSSLIDSDEQLAGRINRNVDKPQCKLFIFDYDDAKVIYGNDYRYKEVKENLSTNEYQEILEKKDFDRLYSLVMEYIKNHNSQQDYADNLPSYLKQLKSLNFQAINREFQLINNSIKTISIFVPEKIPIMIPNSYKENFSQSELDFLREKNKYHNETYVDGENVWELYCDIIENKDPDFTKQKMQKIILQGLISKFSFSVSIYSKVFENMQSLGSGEEKYGFYKLNYSDEVYDYKTGIKNKELDSAIIF